MYKSNLSFWSVDAFLYMALNRCQESVWSSELASRVASFVDAYILFDQVVLLERYRDESFIKALDPAGEVFEFVASSKLLHSDNLANGITLDLSAVETLPSLQSDNYKWFSQHDGYISQDDYENLARTTNITMAEIRLWQHCLTNEVADLTGSVSLLPLSLQEIEDQRPASRGKSISPFQHDRYIKLNEHYQGKLRLVNEVTGTQASSYLTGIPPFLTLMIDQALSPSYLVETLVQMRRDFSELRKVGAKYQAEVHNAKTVRDKVDAIDQWSDSWNTLVKGDFRAPRLLSKKVSSTDVSKSIWNPISAASTATQGLIDYREELNTYKRLSIFSELFDELDQISDLRVSLKRKFFLDFSNHL